VSYFEFWGWYGFRETAPPGAYENYSPLTTPTPTKRP
jgi:hypothetical protein